MSYLVTARKWRPQRFQDVIGQRHVVKTLQNAIASGRIGHAFLFTGSRGVGKTSVARILAKALNCKEGPAVEPCDQCSECQEITKGSSVDVLEIDGASHNSVEDVRELRENARYLPAKSRNKIYIVDEVHMFSNSAFNALLKILEEPPPHVAFIFATTEPTRIPETILSRCQRFDFRRIPLKEILDQLKRIAQEEGVRISEQGLLLICREAEGSMRDAQSLLDQVISYAGLEVKDRDIEEVLGVIDRQWLYETSAAVIGKDAKRCLEIVESLYRHGYPLDHFLQRLIEHFRDLVIVKLGGKGPPLLHLPENEIESLRDRSQRVSLEDLQNGFDLLVRYEESFRRAFSPKMVLEMVLVRMANLPSTRSIQEVLEGIQSIQDRIARIQPFGEGGGGPSPILKGGLPLHTDGESITAVSAPPMDLQQSSLDEIWNGFVEYAKTRKALLAAVLVHGKPLSLQDGRFEIACQNSFCNEKFRDETFRRQVQDLCEEFFQQRVDLSFHLNDDKELPPRKTPRKGDGPALLHGKRGAEEQMRRHPAVQKALEVFGGEILGVKVKEENTRRSGA